jgi:anaerobic selenocysteine-containing dehydrogenase
MATSSTSTSSFTGKKLHYRTCTLCEAMCGIVIETENQDIISIKGDDNDPFSKGYICPKAVALKDIHEDPDRLRQPMLRTEHGWQPISWQQAFERIEHEIKRIQLSHGRDSVAAYLGNPNVHNLGSILFGPGFLRSLKTRNRFSATSVDQLPHHVVAWKLFGHQLKIAVPDIDHCDFFLMFGANPMASNGSLMTAPGFRHRLKALQERGGKLVVIDPRRTETAEVADVHHFIRPGTDALLLLAMINRIFATNRISMGRLEAFTDGVQKVAEFVAPYTPQRVALHTGVDAATIERLVDDFCAARQPVCYGRMGVSVQAFGALSQYLITLLNILTGRLDAPGGLMFTQPAADVLKQTGRGHLGNHKTRVRGLPEFGGEFPVSALEEEITTPGEGRIRALFTLAGNPVLSTPNGAQLQMALQKLDFMVSIDLYINETTQHAHIILPPTSPLERDHYDIIFHMLAVRNTAKYSPALFRKPSHSKHDWEIFLELTLRFAPPRNLLDKARAMVPYVLRPSGMVDMLLRSGRYGGKWRLSEGLSIRKLRQHPHGVDIGPLREDLPAGLWHKNKRIDLAPDFFFADLPRIDKTFFTAADVAAGDAGEFPLRLIGRRHVRSNNSWLHNSERLVKGKNRCTLMIHPQDAAVLRVDNGALVDVESAAGRIAIEAEITEHIMPGVVSIPHGFGHARSGVQLQVAQKHGGVSVNDLTDARQVDVLCGNAVLNAVPVRVGAVQAGSSMQAQMSPA